MEKIELFCPICGEPTNVYMGHARKDRLCRKHGLMKNAGEILENDDGLYIEVATGKIMNINTNKDTAGGVHGEEDDLSDLTCIICGETSNGKHFCLSCYRKYKDKSIDIRIINCRETKILDEYGNLTIECDDGRKVRSRAEALISNFFYNNKIRSVYEKTVYYTDPDTGEDKTLHPDFYLPDYDIYIEYNEIKKKSYLKSKEYTQRIYAMLGFKVIIMDDQDLNSIASCLKPKLKLN